MFNQLTQWLYRTESRKKKFEAANPGQQVIAAAATKGILAPAEKKTQDLPSQGVRRGVEWVTSRRGVLLISGQQVVCGDWSIPVADVEQAGLVKLESAFGTRGYLLHLTTREGDDYRFGLRNALQWSDPKQQACLPFTLQLRSERLGYSTFSVIVRVVMVFYLLHMAWQRFFE